jgi:hypothetical protein
MSYYIIRVDIRSQVNPFFPEERAANMGFLVFLESDNNLGKSGITID